MTLKQLQAQAKRLKATIARQTEILKARKGELAGVQQEIKACQMADKTLAAVKVARKVAPRK